MNIVQFHDSDKPDVRHLLLAADLNKARMISEMVASSELVTMLKYIQHKPAKVFGCHR